MVGPKSFCHPPWFIGERSQDEPLPWIPAFAGMTGALVLGVESARMVKYLDSMVRREERRLV
ncbi:MAG: hypothetical protein OXR07_07405, partial [Nitrospira sp.]|nr:hypothetical protein [Nitrospira sp.]